VTEVRCGSARSHNDELGATIPARCRAADMDRSQQTNVSPTRRHGLRSEWAQWLEEEEAELVAAEQRQHSFLWKAGLVPGGDPDSALSRQAMSAGMRPRTVA
jgi:hypothetical protein